MIVVNTEIGVFRRVDVTQRVVVDEVKFNAMMTDGVEEKEAIERLVQSGDAVVLDQSAKIVE